MCSPNLCTVPSNLRQPLWLSFFKMPLAFLSHLSVVDMNKFVGELGECGDGEKIIVCTIAGKVTFSPNSGRKNTYTGLL